MSRKTGVRIALLTALAAVSLSATAQTTAPSTGMGQSWPNAQDVSTNPNYHVYVFQLNGMKYIQINDLNGVVHGVVGVVSSTPFALPIGQDAQNVQTTQTSSAPASDSNTVYNDGTTSVDATPSTTSNAMMIKSQTACGNPLTCSGVN